jgi:quinolinate synthase
METNYFADPRDGVTGKRHIMDQQDIKNEIRELLKKRNAVLLAHN